MNINIEDIQIPENYKYCSEEKINKAKRYIEETGTIDKPVLITVNNKLVDGYSRYLAAKEMKLKTIPYNCTDIVYGKFVGNPKKYMWANTKHLPVKPGDIIVVENQDCNSKVVVVKRVTKPNFRRSFYPTKRVLERVDHYEG